MGGRQLGSAMRRSKGVRGRLHCSVLPLVAFTWFCIQCSRFGISGGLPELLPRLSEEARAARAPRPPEELVGALQDRIHREPGAFRAAKSVRVRNGG